MVQSPCHPALRRVVAASLAPGGRLLLADPFRPGSLRFLDALEAEGWSVTCSRWEVDDITVGVFEAAPGP